MKKGIFHVRIIHKCITGYTATAAANLFMEGIFSEKGVFPPELVGKHEVCFRLHAELPGREKYNVPEELSSIGLSKIRP